jgi:hypothetical protein
MLAAAWAVALAALLLNEPQVESPTAIAGDYYRGDGLGLNWSLSLKPDGTYSFSWHGCMGLYAEREGRFSVTGALLILDAASSATSAHEMSLPSRFMAVRWGSRLYLIPEEEGSRLAAYVTRGFEPRRVMHGSFLLRESDWEKPARGLPEVPAEWQKWLLRTPVEARVTRVLARHRAEIGAGSKQELHPGMLLSLVSRKYGSTDVRVVSVGPSSSVVENEYGDPPFVSGGRVTSKAW